MQERGFTLVEILVSTILFVAVGLSLLGMEKSLILVASNGAASRGGTVGVEQQIDQFRSDAATSFAVFVPSRDVHGNVNVAADGSGHEIDFYSRNDTGTPIFWAYEWDATARKLQRYDYDTAGNVGQADRTTGAINKERSYPALAGVTSFTVESLEATDLVGAKSPYASPLATVLSGNYPRAFPVGYDDGSTVRPDLYGGNATVQVKISNAHERRTVHLASAALPSGFTIHDYPEIRAIVYRRDTTDRSWLGLVQKSHVFIQARLLISYSHFSEAHPIVWCDYNLYGYPHGLEAPFHAEANYQPAWFPETTAGIVYHVIHGRTAGSRCSKTPPRPEPDQIPAALFSAPPGTQETPPPCFLAGQCWPPEAPSDFSPSPAPSSSPPAWWCSTHARSTLCDGRGGLETVQAAFVVTKQARIAGLDVAVPMCFVQACITAP